MSAVLNAQFISLVIVIEVMLRNLNTQLCSRINIEVVRAVLWNMQFACDVVGFNGLCPQPDVALNITQEQGVGAISGKPGDKQQNTCR